MYYDADKIREYFKKDRFAAGIGVVIDKADENSVKCSMGINDNHRNAAGGVQGGAIFTLADLCFAVHGNLDFASGLAGARPMIGQSCSISYLKGSGGTKLFAESVCLRRGRRMSVYRVSIYDDTGTDVAEMLCNGFTADVRE